MNIPASVTRGRCGSAKNPPRLGSIRLLLPGPTPGLTGRSWTWEQVLPLRGQSPSSDLRRPCLCVELPHWGRTQQWIVSKLLSPSGPNPLPQEQRRRRGDPGNQRRPLLFLSASLASPLTFLRAPPLRFCSSSWFVLWAKRLGWPLSLHLLPSPQVPGHLLMNLPCAVSHEDLGEGFWDHPWPGCCPLLRDPSWDSTLPVDTYRYQPLPTH